MAEEKSLQKREAGRPKIEFSPEQWDHIEKMASIMCTGEEIANIMQVDYDTLVLRIKDRGYKDFPEWYKKHSDNGRMSLRRKQFQLAEKNAAMAIFLGKNYLGQTDKMETHTEAQIIQINYSDDQVEKAVQAARMFKESQDK